MTLAGKVCAHPAAPIIQMISWERCSTSSLPTVINGKQGYSIGRWTMVIRSSRRWCGMDQLNRDRISALTAGRLECDDYSRIEGIVTGCDLDSASHTSR